MGIVFGKIDVEEPKFDVMLHRTTKSGAKMSYDIRKYGVRYGAEIVYDGETGSPFMKLAKYIGVVGGSPENEGGTAVAMTAPVVMQNEKKGTSIAMTAPVIQDQSAGTKRMEFVLPAEYDDISKIPKPLDPAIHIVEIPAAVGAVHRFAGSWSQDSLENVARDLAQQLNNDGLKDIPAEKLVEQYQFWGYNPPFTIPMFRRNEIWIPLTAKQAQLLIDAYTQPDQETN
eukprot:CAMPEP_0118695302 /NCGR_PEP_ID=MMETSP0800-20121206/13098_1 /TAXON_ID=210618 ORGANISM="Striatella unipunctata, Strain CCMP2910" /NCGR_SAMPLE_ID=MMETSP0800 /ASSEMBLY_ACC=CAM_ASM_000638 /LENGTH=227 /DNA_ID=CAMNT_0006594053 /DNA_START=55 /DNA_END=738 /DNA_ORIENTATION=-